MTKITRVTGGSRGEDAQAALAEIQAMGRRAIAFQFDTGDVTAFAPFADPSADGAAREGAGWPRDRGQHGGTGRDRD